MEESFKGEVILNFYRPQTKLREGNVFTPVCDSVHSGGEGAGLGEGGVCMVKGVCVRNGGAVCGKRGHAWWRECAWCKRDTCSEGACLAGEGACMAGGGACMVGGACIARGHVLQGRGAFVAWGRHGRVGMWRRGCACRRDGHQRRWYASSWNVFLLCKHYGIQCFISEGWCSFDAYCFLFHDVRYINGRFHSDVWRRQDHQASGKGECHG